MSRHYCHSARRGSRPSTRTTSDTKAARDTLTLTANEIDMLPSAHHHCHSISSHDATKQLRSLERQRRAATSASPMTVTYPPVYKSGRLSNVASSLSQRPSRNATKQLRPLEQRAISRLPERSPIIYSAYRIPMYENVMLSNVASSLS